MGRYENMMKMINERKQFIKNVVVSKPPPPPNKDAKIDIDKVAENKINIEELNKVNELFGKGLNLQEYKLQEKPNKKGRRKKLVEFDGSFNF